MRAVDIIRAKRDGEALSRAAIDAFVAGQDGLGAAAGVRQALAVAARKDSRFRTVDGAFMSIDQAFVTYSEGMTLASTNAQPGDPGACRRR